jgi:hypothetical protein
MKVLITPAMQLKYNEILSVRKLSQVAVAPSSVVAGEYLRFCSTDGVTYTVGYQMTLAA